MKTVLFTSPYLDVAEFPDARIGLRRGVPTQVTDEQAAILLSNPDVTLAAPASGAASAPAPAAIVDLKPAVKAAVAKASTAPESAVPAAEVN